MKCRLLRRRQAHLRVPTPGAAAIAAQLRAQIPCSNGWKDWRARLKATRVPETANLSFCAAFADCRHGPTRTEGHIAVT
jgi:hypothetical protein